ncbi:integrin alpha-9-like [Antedon mediterranea]|uniref:integrin alpha-9-like n=1 Tax=Antedon mediterranea TaxID=105859 RepID=UPI003AF80614
MKGLTMRLFSLSILLYFLTYAIGFNIDVQNPWIYYGPANSHFGYTVMLHENSREKWLLVGSPKDQSNYQPSLQKPGALYKCYVSSGRQYCGQVQIDLVGNERTTYDVRPLVQDQKDNQWLGSSLTREPFTGRVAVCGHRWANTFYADAILPNGVCYKLDSALNYMTVEKIRPCLTETQIKADINGRGIPWHGWCQAGFSAEYSIDGNTLILGAVGSLAWRGSVVSVTETGMGPEINVADVSSWYPSREEDESYIGYSVSSGYFVRSDLVHGVTGAPRAYQKGKVFIYDLATFSVHTEFFGEKMNTYFGAAVKGIDLNKDGLTDLLVGAPLYSNIVDEGRVYIYMNQGRGILRPLKEKLSGSNAMNARFGTVIENIGDLNQDRYDDVAIGAPYEDDNSGAVYIYSTSYSGIRLRYTQRIAGKDIDPFVRSFGSSISGKVDIDGNIYPDIAVGAFLQNKVFVLRTKPIVKMETTLKISPNPINKNHTNCIIDGKAALCLSSNMCIRYTGIAVPQSLRINYTLSVEKNKVLTNRAPRVVFLYMGGKTTASSIERLEVGLQHCYKYEFQVKKEVTDFLSPIPFHFTYDLIVPEPPMLTCLGGPCPTLDMSSAAGDYEEVRFAHNCGNDQVCMTDLRLSGEVQIPGGSRYLPLGLQRHIYAMIHVQNMGEEAHQAKVYITFPKNVVFIKSENARSSVVTLCEPNFKLNSSLTTVICDIGNPMPAKVESVFRLKLDVSAVTGDQQGFHVIMEANSSSHETNFTKKNNIVSQYIRVRVEADVTVKGVAHPEQVEFGLKKTDVNVILEQSLDHVQNVSERSTNRLYIDELSDEGQVIGPSFTHVYHARNMGPSTIPYPSTVNITIPWRTKEGDWLIYIKRVEVEGLGECDYNSIFKAQHVLIREQYNNVTTGLQQVSGANDVTFNTKIKSQRLNCNTAECVTLVCNVDVMPIDAYLIVRIYARIWEHSFISLNLGLAEILTTAEIFVDDALNQHIEPLNHKPNIATVSTTVYTEEAVTGDTKLPFWIIISSVLVGLISLILIVFILRKVGFFHRKHKEELDQLIEDDKYEREGLTSRQAIEEIWSNSFHDSDMFSK